MTNVKDAAMSPGEFRSIIDYLGFSQGEIATALGVSTRTVRHWIAGRYTIPADVRPTLDRFEARTSAAVADLVAAMNASPGLAVQVYRTDEALWESGAEKADRWMPARWWRHVVMRACAEVPGVKIEFDEDIERWCRGEAIR